MSNKKRVFAFSQKATITFVAVTTILTMSGLPYLAPFKTEIAEAAAPTAGQVVISELKVQDGADTTKQFVELYNTTGNTLDLASCGIYKALSTSTADLTNVANWTAAATIDATNLRTIPAYGYFLFAPAGYQPYGMVEDIAGTMSLGTTGGFVAFVCGIGGTPILIDQLGYGTVTTMASCKGSSCAPLPGNGSIERKAKVTSIATTMGWGGTDQFLGNAYDAGATDLADFVLRAQYQEDPQKSTSPFECANFIIMNVMPMGPNTVTVVFNKMIDSTTALPAVATLSTANTSDTHTITSVTVKNGTELEIYASAANINPSAGTDTITISSALKATDGTSNSSTSAKTIQMNMPPEVTGVQYVSNDSIKIYFNKAMEETSTETAAVYSFFVNGTVNTTITNTDLSLDSTTVGGTGKILIVTKANVFANLGNAGADYVAVDYAPASTAKDSQGSPLQPTFGWQREFTIDSTAPTVTSGMYDATAKTITVYFSEELLPGTGALTSAYYTVSAGCGTKIPDFKQNLDGPPSYNTVVLACPDALSVPFTVTVTSVTDKAHNVIVANGTTNVYTASASANNPIRIASVNGDPSLGSDNMMMEGCTNKYGMTGNYYESAASKNNCDLNAITARDRLTIVFDGAINPVSINYDSSAGKAYNIGSRLEVFQRNERTISGNTTLAACQSYETYIDVGSNEPNADSDKCVNKSMGNLGNSFGVLSNSDKTLTIYLQGTDVMLWPGMEVNPIGIMGMNGLTALQSATASNNQFTMTFAEVKAVKATGLTATSTVTLFFGSDMKRTDLDDATELAAKLFPVQHMPYYQEHSWGTTPGVAWGDYSDTFVCTIGDNVNYDSSTGVGKDCLKITLGTSPTVANKDELMIKGTFGDENGMPLGWGGKIDTTVLALSSYIWNGTSNTLVLEFNKEIKDYNATGSPPTPNFSNNTIAFTDANTGGVTISTKEPVFETAGAACDLFKKIKLVFSGAIEANDVINFSGSLIGDQNGTIVPNITVVTATPVGNQVAPIADTQGPVLAKLITNDWNRDGIMNGGDELLFKFDNDTDTTDTTLVCDVDYTKLYSSSINAEFIVKRSGIAQTNAFGDFVNFWVDMWGDKAGELHINLGPGANILPGDQIWATGLTLADFGGNKMSTLAALATIQESRDAQINRVVYTDVDTSATLTAGDTFKVYFSSAIDPTTLGSYVSTATPPVTNIQWGLGIEFNWQGGNTATYSATTMKSWGSTSSANWSADFKELTITLAGADFSMADFDLVKPYGVRTADGAWVNKPGLIDLTAPTLTQVLGEKASGAWPNGNLTFVFSEPMDDTTLHTSIIATLATDLGLVSNLFGATGSSALWLDPEKKFLKVVLGSDSTILDATTFNPANTVKDKNGISDNTLTAVGITTTVVKPASNVILADGDTVNPGLDGRDVNVSWKTSATATSAYYYYIYLLPDFIPFRPDVNNVYLAGETTHFPIGYVSTAVACPAFVSGTASDCSYTGPLGLMSDSRTSANTSTGVYDPASPFFPISDVEGYVAYVVSDDGSANKSFPQRSPIAIRFTMEYGGGMDNKAPWVEHTTPFDGAIVPLNTTKFELKFSEPMKRDTIEASGRIKLQKCSADCQTENNWSDVSGIYVSYNADYNRAEMSSSANLTANAKYRIDIPSPGVQDMSGLVYTGRPVYFRASSESDTTPPKVIGNSFQFERVGTLVAGVITAVPRTEPMVGIAFDKNMDASTFTTTSVTLTPSVPGSTFFYDPKMMGMAYFFGSSLAKNTTYTLTLSGVYIKDTSNNTLDGDGNGTAAGTTSDNYTLTFTSENADIDTTTNNTTIKPIINWINSDGHHIGLGFSADMKQSAAIEKANWILKDSSGVVVSLQSSGLNYDPFMKELHIGPIEITPGQNYTLTPNSSVLGMNGVMIDTTNVNNVSSFTPKNMDVTFVGGQFGADMYQAGGMMGTGGMFSQTNMNTYNTMMTNVVAGSGAYTGVFDPGMATKMYGDNAYMDKDVKAFMPINVWPMNQVEGKVTNYHIGFPTTKAIPHAGKIVLKFPTSFDVTNAAVAEDQFMDLGAGVHPLFFPNQDINGPGGIFDESAAVHPSGRAQIKSVANNNMDKTITLTLDVEDSTGCTLNNKGVFNVACTNSSATVGRATTMPFDYFDFELSGIKNGSASEIDWRTDTGGYQITITTKDNNGAVLEGTTEKPIKSMKFPIKAAGAGGISGKVTSQDGVTAIASAMVFIDSPMSGPIDATTSADGTYSVSGLPVAAGSNTYEGWYHIRVESPKNNDTYFGGADFDVQLTQSSPTKAEKNVKLSTAANTLTVKLTITSALNGQDIMVWVGGPGGHNEKKFTLDTTDDDNVTAGLQNHLDIKVANGEWDVGVHPYFAPAMFTQGPPPPPAFLAPASKHITVSGNTDVSLSLVSGIANYEITGIVKDASTLKGFSNIHVRAFTTFGQGFSSDTDTRTDGSFTLKVPAGFYQLEASKPGLPPVMGKTVEVKTASVGGVEILVQKPARTISGKVTDGTNPIPRAGVNAWDNTGRFVFSETDANGGYDLFVDQSSSWQVEAFAPGFGKLSPDTGVTPTNLNTTSADVTGINFNTAQSNIVTISGTVKDASGNAVNGVAVRADKIGWFGGTEGAMTGQGISVKTDADGAYTLKVPASFAGTGTDATRYKISATDANTGKLTPVSGVSATANVTSTNDSRLNLTTPTSRTITVDIQNAPTGTDDNLLNPDDTENFFNGKAMLKVYSDTSAKGNQKEVSDTDLSNTSDGTINVPEASGYRAKLYVPGYGEFTATENGTTGFSVSGSDKTIHFDLKRGDTVLAPISVGGTVTGAGGAALANSYISVINETTFETVGEMTDSSGNYTVKVPNKNPDGTAAHYKVRVDKDGYTPPTTVETNISATKADANFAMAANSAAITGTVYADAAKTTPVANAVVMAKEVGGEGFVKIKTDSEGKFIQASDNAINVAPDKTWNLTAKSVTGSQGQKVNVSSGTGNIDIVLAGQVKAAQAGQLTTAPKTEAITPASGGTINYVDTLGMKLDIPELALGDSTLAGGVHVTLKETAAIPETTDFKPLGGIGKEITSTTEIQQGKTVELEFVYEKDKLEAMTETGATVNNLAQLSNVTNVYWNDTANNYVSLATTRSAEVKASASDAWTPVEWTTFIDAIDSSDGDGAYNTYNDYKITLASETDHFTIFGLKTGADILAPGAPATPTGLAAVSGASQVSLSWTANTEVDMMEYEIYRGTTSAVIATDANQVNTSQIAKATTSYVDTTAINWTTYYYKITAVDDSLNESTASSPAVQICPHPLVSYATVSSLTCAVTCDSGYTLSTDGHSCSIPGSAVVGGGGAGEAPAQVVAMPTTTTGEVTATATGGGKTTITTTENIQAAVKLPAYAVSASTQVSVVPIAKTEASAATAVSAAPTGTSIVGGNIYNITAATTAGASVTTFSKYVTITLTYTDSQITGLKESSLTINYWDAGQGKWNALATTVDKTANILTAQTLHFTWFSIMGEQGIEEAEKVEAPDRAALIANIKAQMKEIIRQIIALITQLIAQLRTQL